MRIQLETVGSDTKLVRAYAVGQVTINQETYRSSLLLTPARVVSDWPPTVFADLQAHHFDAIRQLEPELVILGTGRRLRFPAAAMIRVLTDAQVGVEVMDTAAACRTYNILAAEGRRVVAALLMIEE
jgi:uncharacterized protein